MMAEDGEYGRIESDGMPGAESMAVTIRHVRPITDDEILELSRRNPGYQFERTVGGELVVTPTGSEGGRRSGELIAILYDVVGNAVETIPSPIDGWVIMYRLTGNRTATSGDMVAFVFGAA